MRPASHHETSRAVRKPPRPERNGSVYSEAMVHHSAATSSAQGSRMRAHFTTTIAGLGPERTNPSAALSKSRIQVKPDARKRNVSCLCAGNDCCKDASIRSPPEESAGDREEGREVVRDGRS